MRTEKAASKVTIKHNENPNPFGFGFLLCADRFEKLNAARMSAAREGLTERHNNFYFPTERKLLTNLAGTSKIYGSAASSILVIKISL